MCLYDSVSHFIPAAVYVCREPVLCLQQLMRGLSLPPVHAMAVVENLSTFSVLFSLYLGTLHDAEFYREQEGVLYGGLYVYVMCSHSSSW